MRVFINPGAGPVQGATEENAIENIKVFIADMGIDGIKCVRLPEKDSDGRFAFLLEKNGFVHEVKMPGLPCEKVRYVDDGKQNIFDFPRLYVNGASWIWPFALLQEADFEEVD